MGKKILVVTATLGNRPSIKRTIESVENIGIDNVQHIIIAPLKKTHELKKLYPKLECIAEPEHCKGIYSALNYVFNKYAHDYEYITFINDDDYWLPNFKLLIDKADLGYDFIYGKVNFVFDNEDKKDIPMACSNQFDDFIPLLNSNIVLFTQQATLIKSELFFKLNGFSENYKLVSDTLFWAQLSLQKIKFVYISKACAAYTIQDNQLSSNKELQRTETKAILESLPECSKYRIVKALIFFRLKNLMVYLKRIIKKL